MRKLFATVVMASVFTLAAWAQESEDETELPRQAEEAEAVDADAAAPEAADSDQGSYADAEDDDFRPSEEIPADQSTPFPTDI